MLSEESEDISLITESLVDVFRSISDYIKLVDNLLF